jgi:hypothetical protein
MGRLTLAPEDWQRIKKALQSSFALRQLDNFVEASFATLYDDVDWRAPAAEVVHDLVARANNRGILDQLLVAVSAVRPDRPDLRALALYYAQQPGWSAALETYGLPLASGLELLTTRGDPFMDTTRLAAFLIRAERQVCQVQCPTLNGMGHGTGFLVGPDLVLTCYHVVKGHLAEGFGADQVRVRFDYRCAADGTAPPYTSGEWLPIDPAWNIPRSPPSKADILLLGEPKQDELDFALLKLQRRIGAEPPPGETAPRGWVDLSTDPPVPPRQAPVLIVQHPGTGQSNPPQHPLKVAIAPGFEGPNGNGTRFIYTPSTLQGSSGSPVFGPDYRAVAMHHNRGTPPDVAGLVKSNRGIPLAKIRAALAPEIRARLIPPPQEGDAP